MSGRTIAAIAATSNSDPTAMQLFRLTKVSRGSTRQKRQSYNPERSLIRFGKSKHEVVESQHLTRVPQIGEIIEVPINQKAVRPEVVRVASKPDKVGRFHVDIDEV
jgi:hypothetical protein